MANSRTRGILAMSSLAVVEQNGGALATEHQWNREQIDLIKNHLVAGGEISDGELGLFEMVCRRTGLDPFARQIYPIMRKVWNPETKKKEPKLTIQTSIDGFRLIADRTGKYAGSETYWCGEDGEWKDVWLSSKPPAAAKTVVWRHGSDHSFSGVARFDAYKQEYNGELSGLWAKMPDVMIAKCSESLSLRKAFPAELSGIYTREETAQADNDYVDAPAQQTNVATQAAPTPKRKTTAKKSPWGRYLDLLKDAGADTEKKSKAQDWVLKPEYLNKVAEELKVDSVCAAHVVCEVAKGSTVEAAISQFNTTQDDEPIDAEFADAESADNF